MYDAMADAAMMSIMMRRSGYHIGAAPPVYVDRGGIGIGGVFVVIVISAAVVIVVVVVTRNS